MSARILNREIQVLGHDGHAPEGRMNCAANARKIGRELAFPILKEIDHDMGLSQTLPPLPLEESKSTRVAPPNREHQFYSGTALAYLALMILGFLPFYMHGRAYLGREIDPRVRPLMIIHGVCMTVWMLLFVLQTLLIGAGNRRLHMVLGPAGAALTGCMFLLGLRVSTEATRVTPPDLYISGLAPHSFMIVPFTIIGTFGMFAAIGLWNRRRPKIHRPMMLLAGLATMPAPFSRMHFINIHYYGTIWERRFGEFFAALVFGAILVAVKWLMTRSFDRWFTLGYAALAATCAVAMRMATSAIWERIAGFLLR